MNKIRQHLSYANIVATLALFLVLSGGAAFAVTRKVGSKELQAGAVTAAKIKKGAVGEGKLADGAVSGAKLATGAVTAPKLAAGSVGAGQLADGAVASAKLADGSVSAPKLADDSVSAPKLADGAVTNPKLAPDSVTGADVKDHSLTGADIESRTLDPVPEASAVDGESMLPFSSSMTVGEPEATLLEFAGVKVTAACRSVGGGTISLGNLRSGFGRMQAQGAEQGVGKGFSVGSGTFGPTQQFVTLGSDGAGTAEVEFADGTVTSLELAWRQESATQCNFFGRVTGRI
jgi:hypothetical protein